MNRYICIHGHFYQPPRENPWLEAVELQDSAHPYHDWNERLTAECYAPNTVARILDNDSRIAQIVNNYTRMSFNFGPTLLNWMKRNQSAVYQKIIEADQQSRDRFAGHGSAIAQVYNHVIMPLTNQRDKRTQVIWGIRDFAYHFGRQPEGMWLAETAVDLETLELLVEHGIRYTILAPHQANRIKSPAGDWYDVSEKNIDPTRAYYQMLPSGKQIALFFYDAPIAHDAAFGNLLSSGERFARRLMTGFDDGREHPQLVHIATDGERYGHHYHYGDMALAYALQYIEANNIARLTNYGEYLEYHPPEWEVEIRERTSWECPHGVDRWSRHCGCNSGNFPGWTQEWREPLRTALDWLRESLEPLFEARASEYFTDPWVVRDDYISVILDRSPENVSAFLNRYASRGIDESQYTEVLKLMELQRQLLQMYTSCGWFFDEISSTETIQVLKYAGRALHLARGLFAKTEEIEQTFLQRLEHARSNIAQHRNGRLIYERWVQPAEVDLVRVGAHYAVTSLFERYFIQSETHTIYCYRVEQEDYQRFEPGMSKVVVGRARITSLITNETQNFSFGVLHFGDNNVNAGVREHDDEATYHNLVERVAETTERADIAEVVRLLDGYFEGLGYSIQTLFRDEQRTFLELILQSTLDDDEAIYRQLYERRTPLMHMLTSLQTPLPKTLHAAAEFVVNSDLRHAVEETPPDIEAIGSILERARIWNIELDKEEFIYTLDQTMEQLSEQLLAQPENPDLLKNLDTLVEVAHLMPFDVDFWKIQNAYYEMITTIYPEIQESADEGEEDALSWTDHFMTLGDKLGIRITEMQDFSTAPTVASVTREVIEQSRIPLATYRFQFNPDFTFAHAQELIPYLHDLGISHCYASPIFKARAGSSHGYDVCDHSIINPVIGGEEGFDHLSTTLQQHGMSMIVDIVPNHMGIGDECNRWWMDVLENGPSSDYAAYFDIEWHPVKPELANKVLLPILGDQYGRILENGELKLVYEDGSFAIYYWENKFPIAPGTYSAILGYQLERLTEELGDESSEELQEFQSILTAINYLPPRTELDPEKLVERNREKEVIKRRIDALYQESTQVREAIDAAVQSFNGKVGDPRSFDLLDALIEDQSYRLAYWRVAAEEINYRRFFDINDLAAIRTEDPQVFSDTHELIFRLLTENKISGLRIDHIDGLFDPAAYFEDLQHSYVFHQVQARLAQVRTNMPDDETLRKRIAARMDAWRKERLQAEGERKQEGLLSYPLYVVAEKILSEDEPLPQNWAVHGTTGYDFLATVNGLFINTDNGNSFDTIYRNYTRNRISFQDMVRSNKKLIMLVSMDSEIYALSHQLERIAERNRRYRDFTLNMLTFAIREVISSLSVYRTYITGTDMVLARDRQYIEAAVGEAKRRNPRTAEAVFDFIQETLLLQNVPDFSPEEREPLLQWVRKFQQVTGPVMAKGVEDTTFYVYNRLTSLNEVGGHPSHFGNSVSEFHHRNAENHRLWPHTMLTTSTHDTKRSEDVRARLGVLSEMPERWQAVLERWSTMNSAKKTIEDDRDGNPMAAPDSNDEYLLYQSLLGAWPINPSADQGQQDSVCFPLLPPQSSEEWNDFCQRIVAYMQKATKEAKVHTSWVQPNQDYDTAVQEFIYRILDTSKENEFLQDIFAFAQHIAWCGQFNALSQLLLKLTSPGVPDIYQGTELWNLSLVDPDNRRPVDFGLRQHFLAEMKQRLMQHGEDLTHLTHELLDTSHDGRIKLYLMYRTLAFRRTHTNLFDHGRYLALEATGQYKAHVCAFARTYEDEEMLVVVPRLVYRLCNEKQQAPMGKDIWQDTWLVLPETAPGQRYRHHFTGETFTVGKQQDRPGLPLADISASFPLMLLEKVTD
jgi:(1->4)-alpha-D-glucan 1-alpha-D-glucosylmutase